MKKVDNSQIELCRKKCVIFNPPIIICKYAHFKEYERDETRTTYVIWCERLADFWPHLQQKGLVV